MTNTNGGVITLWAVWQQQVTYYTLTVSNGYICSSGSTSGSYTSGTSVQICANVPSGNTFTSWSSNNGGPFANSSSSTTTFTMPSANVTVTAGYTAKPVDCSESVHPTTTTPCRMSGDGALYIWGNNKNTTTFTAACTNITGSVNHEATCTGCPSGYSWVTRSQMTNLKDAMRPSVVYKYLGEGSITFWSSTEYNNSTAFKIMVMSNAVTPSSASKTSASHYVFCRKN